MSQRSNYRSIVYFDAVRRYGSVREAARHLGVAASAVNRQVLNFEVEIGMPLFERLPNGMTLTPAGEAFARHAIAVLQDERRVAQELDALKGLRRGELSILAAESLNSAFLPKIMQRMHARYPGVQVHIRTIGSNAIPDEVIAGNADIGLAFSLPHHRELQQLAVARFRLGAVMRPDHPLLQEVQEQQIAFSSCTRYPLILPHRELSIQSLLEPQLRRFDGRMTIIAEVNSLELMKNLTLGLNAVSFQSRIGLETELESGQLVHVPLFRPGPILTEVGVYIRQGRALSALLDVVVSMARDDLAELEKLDASA
jgi:DNA-binding transcriptional LysR family regulator